MEELLAAFKELQEATTNHDEAFKIYDKECNAGETWATWGESLSWGQREVENMQEATEKFEAALNSVIDKRVQKAIAKLA